MVMEWKDKYGFDALHVLCEQKTPIPDAFCVPAAACARRFHAQLPGYAKTPLRCMSHLAGMLNVKGLYVKDEALRFGLNAFKGLGGSYAMFRVLCHLAGLNPETASLHDLQTDAAREKIGHTQFVTATDGNHGKGVAWAGGLFQCGVHVYMPKGTVPARVEAIRRAGPAEVTVTDVNYDETVRFAEKMSTENGWYLLQDTSFEGYEEIPTWIVQGYMTMAAEITEELDSIGVVPTHVFLQAGVGSMAGGVLGYLHDYYGCRKPVTVIVEPHGADCIYLSCREKDGNAHTVPGDPVTIMAGLNCGTPCGVTWPVLRDHAAFCVSCPDYAAAHGMRLYRYPEGGDDSVIAGESGASTLGAAALILTRDELKEVREAMGLNQDSVILLINTEGATDPVNYRLVTEQNAYPLP